MTILLLSGTAEARALAKQLAAEDIAAIASLAGATRAPVIQPIPTRIGGFGGEAGFRAYLDAAKIAAVLDATHPFAARISHRTARICAQLGVPYCQVLRPAWHPAAQDQWIPIAREEDAAEHIGGQTHVFLATGRQTLDRFANLEGRQLYCRQIDPPDQPFPFANGRYIVGRPPFTVEQEMDLFQSLKIDWLVVKNAGGETSFTKLVAARELGIPVLMIERPPQPDALCVSTVNAAMAWVRDL